MHIIHIFTSRRATNRILAPIRIFLRLAYSSPTCTNLPKPQPRASSLPTKPPWGSPYCAPHHISHPNPHTAPKLSLHWTSLALSRQPTVPNASPSTRICKQKGKGQRCTKPHRDAGYVVWYRISFAERGKKYGLEPFCDSPRSAGAGKWK